MRLLYVALVVVGYLGKSDALQAVSLQSVALPLNITLVVFSGVPDPQWQIESHSSIYQRIRELFNDTQLMYLPEQMPAKLGYKGFLVQDGSKEPASLILGTKTIELQQLLLKSMPRNLIPENFLSSISKVIAQGSVLPVETDPEKPVIKRTAPSYNWWTRLRWNNCYTKPRNNCYNYANNKATNTFAQPGTGSGYPFMAITDVQIENAATQDGLIRMIPHPNLADPVPDIPEDPSRHLVALVVAPGVDFHWYRLDSNKRWSHKPGRTSVTNLDSNQQMPIDDPRSPNLNPPGGPNYVFVCFMTTDKNTVTIA